MKQKVSIRSTAVALIAGAGILLGAESAAAQSKESGGSQSSPPPVAGTATLGVTQAEMRLVALGWSAKQKILNKAVYNDKGERIGTIEDIIVSPDRTVSFAIIGVGGFLGIKKHDVAIPVSQLKPEGDRMILPGATKEALKALPEFQYARS
jgi:sporulation protein YlmC with PRC-barrel domain